MQFALIYPCCAGTERARFDAGMSGILCKAAIGCCSAEWLLWPEAVWKRAGISAAIGWIQKLWVPISGFPADIPNKNGKKARLGLHRCH
jgi:hypothetical protein